MASAMCQAFLFVGYFSNGVWTEKGACTGVQSVGKDMPWYMRCTDDGKKYLRRQCEPDAPMWWCADPVTGEYTGPESTCTPCMQAAEADAEKIAAGVQNVSSHRCQSNGLYQTVQNLGGGVFCVTADGKPEPCSDAVMKSCAYTREVALFELSGSSAGPVHVPRCQRDRPSGYSPKQCIGDRCWCVDPEDGTPSGVPLSACSSCAAAADEAAEMGQLVPNCRADGTYESVQHPGVAGPFCVDRYTGVGVACSSEVKRSCVYARELASAHVYHRFPIPGHVPQCDANGGFLPKQCASASKSCWCVDTTTGEPLGRPLSACEKCSLQAAAARKYLEEQKKQGRSLQDFRVPSCQQDGTYTTRQFCSRGMLLDCMQRYFRCVDRFTGVTVPCFDTHPSQ
ncbi:hypothetical protein DIPPA_22704 [Diplonema papillatum]|nr:hypothetical protein DIPPA_22704 [Diplonema papillatum]